MIVIPKNTYLSYMNLIIKYIFITVRKPNVNIKIMENNSTLFNNTTFEQNLTHVYFNFK